MISQKVLNYTKAFKEKFGNFLVIPEMSSISSEDHERAVVTENHIILPAQQKFSDWDIYCLVDSTKITHSILNEMRSFLFSWADFDVVKDYATCNPLHLTARAYQSVGIGKLYWIQFMGMIKDEDFAPFVDIHILGVDQKMLEEFYTAICSPDDTGYLDWSIITLWRKFRKTGEMHKDKTMYQRSIYPALSSDQKSFIDKDTIEFFNFYFKDKKEFVFACNFLKSEFE